MQVDNPVDIPDTYLALRAILAAKLLEAMVSAAPCAVGG